MVDMKRVITVIVAGCGLILALPTGSLATLTEVGVIPATTPPTVPSCPTPSNLAVSRTTGFQVKIEANSNPESAPRAGTVVAWTIALRKPIATQGEVYHA